MSFYSGRESGLDPHRPALVLSAIALGHALQINNGHYAPTAVATVAVGLALAWPALLVPRVLGRLVPDRDGVVVGLLIAGLATQLVRLMLAPFAMYVERPLPRDHEWFVPALMLAAVAAAVAALARARGRWLACGVLVCAHVGLGVLTYEASPDPAIDVVTVHRAAFDALEQGQSPYSITFRDIYEGRENFYPAGAIKDGVVQFGFPYPLVSLLMAWSGQWLSGDFRYAELAALALGAIAIALAGRMTAVAVLAVGLLLFTPRAFFELEQAWTEPLLVIWLGIALWAWRARWMRAAMTAIALMVAVKQYLIVAVPLAWLMPATERRWRHRLRAPIIVGLITVALYAPALVWDANGFVRSVLLVQVNEELRADALSLAVTYARSTQGEISTAVYGVIVAVAMALAAWRAPRTPAGYTAALAVVLFTAFAFGKKAFCNYYFFVLATMCASIAVGNTKITKDHEGKSTTAFQN